jgi:hypothetical protein
MKMRYRRRVSVAALWSRRLGLFAFTLSVVAVLAHRFGPLPTPGFGQTMLVAAALAMLALLLAWRGFSSLWANGDKGGKQASFGMIFACMVLIPYGIEVYAALRAPALHDISTDLADPPQFPEDLFATDPAANDLGSLPAQTVNDQPEAWPDVVPRVFAAPVSVVERIARSMINARRWTITDAETVSDQTPTTNPQTIVARFRTLVLGYDHAIALRLTPDDDGTVVDMRAASRFGERDSGDNAAIIEAFLTELDFAVAAAPPVTDEPDPDAEPAPVPGKT